MLNMQRRRGNREGEHVNVMGPFLCARPKIRGGLQLQLWCPAPRAFHRAASSSTSHEVPHQAPAALEFASSMSVVGAGFFHIIMPQHQPGKGHALLVIDSHLWPGSWATGAE